MTSSDLIARRNKLRGAAYSLFYADPVHLVRGEGVWLYDADGRKYLDMYNNVPHVGHSHPHVVKAICEQAAQLNMHTRYLHKNVLDYAKRLTAKFVADLDTVMFCCTGSEANELALRIARNVTGMIGPDKNILKLRPPMVIRKSEADLMLATLDDVLQTVANSRGV